MIILVSLPDIFALSAPVCSERNMVNPSQAISNPKRMTLLVVIFNLITPFKGARQKVSDYSIS